MNKRKETFGSIIRFHRLRHGISVRDLARRIDRSPSWLSKVERDLEQPSSETIHLLAREFPWPVHGPSEEYMRELAGLCPHCGGRIKKEMKS